jgi:manganese/zinc/iron transport system substrate-binding protein
MRTRSRLMTGLGSAVAAALVITGCSAISQKGGDDALTVYATTGYLADAVANIAPDAVVTTMVGPGGDPHTYQPSTRDIGRIQRADVVLWNGLHLEAQMIDQLESLGDRQIAVGDGLAQELLLSWPETDAEVRGRP